MSVAIILSGQQDVRLVHWAARMARGRNTGLVLLWTHKLPGKKAVSKRCSTHEGDELPAELAEVCAELTKSDFHLSCEKENNATESLEDFDTFDASETNSEDKQLPCRVVSIQSNRIANEVEEEAEKLGVSCLIVPREPQLADGSPEAELIDHLLSHVACEIVLLTAGSEESGGCNAIVSPVGEGPHSASCLRMANEIANVSDAKLVALHVEPAFDETSKAAAERILSKAVDRALGSKQQQVSKRVVLSNDVVMGIKETLDECPDLIILGMKRTGLVQRFSSQGIAEKLVNSNPGPAIAIVQSALPLSSRLGRRVNELLHSYVPQLPRDRRVELVERIQRSSQWDFDFIALIFMSTLIAAGGLIQNSAAVVIGAMLVAPLMTPLLGAGLSITQGNLVLFRSTLVTVLRGFLLAFVTSFVIGMVAGDHVTDEMGARGSPKPLDILVAAVGGFAAAYASGRPNLLSALPGVAIAASLVPPIATSGISFWLCLKGSCDFNLPLMSALLFFVNIVAIVLGTSIAFRSVGIRSSHQHSDFNSWTLGAAAALFGLVLVLGFELGGRGPDQIAKTLNASTIRQGWTCSGAEYKYVKGVRVLDVHLETNEAMTPARLNDIREEISDSMDDPPPVHFVTIMK